MKRLGQGVRTISFGSGKGGVGKTTLLSHVAIGLAEKGNRVLIFDGDLGLANVDIFFNQRSRGHIGEVISGEKEIAEILTPIAPGLDLISGGHGMIDPSRWSAFSRKGMIDAIAQLEKRYDYLLIDTSAGISDNVLYLNTAAQDIVVVITPDAASVTDSYALIKLLHNLHGEKNFSIVCNQVRDEAEGLHLFERFSEVVNRFMSVGLDYTGSMPFDVVYKRSTQMQKPLVRADGKNEASQHLAKIIKGIQNRDLSNKGKGGLQFFWEQVVGVA